MSDHTPRLRPACPDWCTADHQPETASANLDGYLHHSRPQTISLPGLPELPNRKPRGLIIDLYAIQRPADEPDLPARIELGTSPPEATDELAVITSQADLDAALDALREAADALEQWRGLLPNR